MSFATLNTNLFKAIAGENGRTMLDLLVALDSFLDPAQLVDEPTPQQVRVFLRDHIANEHLRLEIEFGELTNTPQAPEQYVYYRLRETGWIQEDRDTGYRYVVWMAQEGRRILQFLKSMSAEHPSLGLVCLSVRSNLSEVVKDPANGSLIRKAMADMEGFLDRMRALVGNIREVLQIISGGQGSFDYYFQEYLGELFLPNIEKLALKGNPNLHASQIFKLVGDIRFNAERLELCVKAYQRDDIEKPTKETVEADLDRLIRAFNSIEPLFAKTQYYNRRITRQALEKAKYTVHTPSTMGQQIEDLLLRIGQATSIKELPSPLFSEELLSESRLAKPKNKPVPAVPTIRRRPKPLWFRRAYNQLQQEHINFQKYDPDRVASFIEKNMGQRAQMTTDDLIIVTADDMMAAWHVRLLAQGVAKTHVLYPLLEKYSVTFDGQEWTQLEHMAGRRLIIRRRTSPGVNKQ